jgi:hypothetical protein
VQIFKAAWDKYIVCPRQSIIDFESALERFSGSIRELFAEVLNPRIEQLFYPSEMRNLILEAGSGMRLMSVTYDNITRTVEPYSLVYKRRQDGHAEEYFYVWDRTGGRRSGVGIKALVNRKVQDLKVLDEKFEPQFGVELAKAGEPADRGYFSRPSFGGGRTRAARVSSGSTKRKSRSGMIYILECGYCGRRFQRSEYTTQLNEHKDKSGNRCFGTFGMIVDQRYSW